MIQIQNRGLSRIQFWSFLNLDFDIVSARPGAISRTGSIDAVAVIKIHFLPETIKRGDRSTRIIKELSRFLGTEMRSLHANEIALEKEKKLVDERQHTCDTLAH